MNNNNFLPSKIFETYNIDSKFVSQGLSKIYKFWTHYSAVLISAPTGSGKNHFIIEELIPHA